MKGPITVTETPTPSGGDLSAIRDAISELLHHASPDPTPPEWLDPAVDGITAIFGRFGDHAAEQYASNAITIRDLAAQAAVLRRAVRRWLIRGVNDGHLTRETAADALATFAMPPLPHTYEVTATVHVQAIAPIHHPDPDTDPEADVEAGVEAGPAATLDATREAIADALNRPRITVTDIQLRPDPNPGPDSDPDSEASQESVPAGEQVAKPRLRMSGSVAIVLAVSAGNRDEATTAAIGRIVQRLIPAIGEIAIGISVIEIDAVRPSPQGLDPETD
jgi:hypothetical protein